MVRLKIAGGCLGPLSFREKHVPQRSRFLLFFLVVSHRFMLHNLFLLASLCSALISFSRFCLPCLSDWLSSVGLVMLPVSRRPCRRRVIFRHFPPFPRRLVAGSHAFVRCAMFVDVRCNFQQETTKMFGGYGKTAQRRYQVCLCGRGGVGWRLLLREARTSKARGCGHHFFGYLQIFRACRTLCRASRTVKQRD